MRIRAKQQNKQQFPNLALEDNLRFEGGGGIEKPFRVYTRQKKNTVAEETEETRTNDV